MYNKETFKLRRIYEQMPLSGFRQASFKGTCVVTIMEKTMFARYVHTRFNYQEKAFYCLKRCFLGSLRINSTVYEFLYLYLIFFLNSYFFDPVFFPLDNE